MVKQCQGLAGLAGLVLLLQGCILGEAHQGVLLGGLAISQGDYQGATIRYLDALAKAGPHEAWIQFNLGNVYHSLGEVAAAQNMWARAATTTDPELLFRVRFNQGVAWYESGRHDLAVEAFKEALILDSSSIETKINLELALLNAAPALSGDRAPETVTNQASDQGELDALRLLEYVERKEIAPWQSGSLQVEEGANDW